MELLALNKQWAVFRGAKSKGKLDALLALQDLLSIKSYQQLISFLVKHAVDEAFLVPSTTDFADNYNREKRTWHPCATDIDLKGNLEHAIERHPSIDYLDGLVISDLKDAEVFQLDLTELIYFRGVLWKFLTIAGVALGAEAPDDIFVDMPSEEVFDAEWIRKNVHCEPGELRTIGLKRDAIGFDIEKILDEYAPDTALNSINGFSDYQLVLDDSKEYGKYTDGYPFSTDCVIYDRSEHECLSGEGAEHRNGCEWYITLSFLDNISLERARMLLAGRVVEAVLNSQLNLAEEAHLTSPYFLYFDQKSYGFVPGKGFARRKEIVPHWWAADLYDEATELIVQGRVSLCPVCGAPVLIKDYRGRKSKLVCSDSCKTKASNRRREAAYRYAASGMSLEEAVERIGEEYARSVRKWYGEAQGLLESGSVGEAR